MKLLFVLREKFEKWLLWKHYEKRHIDFIRTTIQNDLRWLSVHPAGKDLLERYEKLVSVDWYLHDFEDIGELRRRLGWCPHENQKVK